MEEITTQKYTIELDDKATNNLKKAGRWALIFSVMMCVLSVFAIVISLFTIPHTVGFRTSLFVAALLMCAFSIAALVLSVRFKRLVNNAIRTGDGETLTNAIDKLHRFIVFYFLYTLCNIICLAWYMGSLFTMEFYVE